MSILFYPDIYTDLFDAGRIGSMKRIMFIWLILAMSMASVGESDEGVMQRRQNETTTSFWSLFSGDYRKNCLAWVHSPHNPVIPATGNTWKQIFTANPDSLEFGGRSLLYYRGEGVMPNTDDRPHDRIAVAEILEASSKNLSIRDLNAGRFVINVGPTGSFDDKHVLDPAAAIFNGSVYLYSN